MRMNRAKACSQLKLAWEETSLCQPLPEPERRAAIEALADLLREALGAETVPGNAEESDESKDHL